MGYLSNSLSESSSSRNAPSSSPSPDCSPHDHQHSDGSESPRSSTQPHVSEFLNYSGVSENNTGRHVSELTAFSYQTAVECTSGMPACTLPRYVEHPPSLPLEKTSTVASPRVLTASISRRMPREQEVKLHKCPRPECHGTFTARHNLISEPLRPQVAYLLHDL